MGTLTFGADSVAYDAPSRAPKRVSDRVDGTEMVVRRLFNDVQPRWEEQGQRRLPLATTKMGALRWPKMLVRSPFLCSRTNVAGRFLTR